MSPGARLLPSGASAWLVELDAPSEVVVLRDALAASAPEGVVELVPAARTLLVAVEPARLPLETAATWIRRTAAGVAAAGGDRDARRAGTGTDALTTDAGPVVVEVDYRGDDLAETALLLGVSVEHLVARHTATTWQVAFIGFAPGFAYLVAEDWPFDVPRLDVARTRVPAGAIGLASGYSGAYPRESPGGWRLVGRTEAALWDPSADPPALLAPGRAVRFRAVAP